MPEKPETTHVVIDVAGRVELHMQSARLLGPLALNIMVNGKRLRRMLELYAKFEVLNARLIGVMLSTMDNPDDLDAQQKYGQTLLELNELLTESLGFRIVQFQQDEEPPERGPQLIVPGSG